MNLLDYLIKSDDYGGGMLHRWLVYSVFSLALLYGYYQMDQNNQRSQELIRKNNANCSLKEERLKGQIDGLEKVRQNQPSVTVNNKIENRNLGLGKQDGN